MRGKMRGRIGGTEGVNEGGFWILFIFAITMQ